MTDLLAEYFGGLHNGSGSPVELLKVCRRLVASPGTDADRAGEPLLVFAVPLDRSSQTIALRVVGERSGETYLDWQYRNSGRIDQDDFSGYVMTAAAALTVCLNGPENSPPEAIEAMYELGRLVKADHDGRRSAL